jgi:hypothetical protein
MIDESTSFACPGRNSNPRQSETKQKMPHSNSRVFITPVSYSGNPDTGRPEWSTSWFSQSLYAYVSIVLFSPRCTPWLTYHSERPLLVGEVSANFCGYMMPRGQCDGSLRPYSRFSRPEPILFLSSSWSVVLTRMSGTRFRSATS